MKNKNLYFQIIIIIIVAFIIKSPLIISSNMLLDGDECVVGLMAKHMIEGKGFPIYFYGQQYGFTLVETLMVSLFYLVFGVSAISVKFAMLTLFMGAALFFYFALKNFSVRNSLLPLFFTLLLISSPAWTDWAMKARGGYLTSFLFSSIIFYLLSKGKESFNAVGALVLGICILFVYESQPIWLPGLIPLLVYFFIKLRSIGKTMLTLLVSILGFYILKAYKSQLPSVWAPKVLSSDAGILSNLTHLPGNIYKNFTGSYFHTFFSEGNAASKFLAIFFTACMFLVILYSIYYLVQHKKIISNHSFSLVSVLACLAYPLLLMQMHYRYLLPLLGFVLIHMFFVLHSFTPNKLINSFFILIILFGITHHFMHFTEEHNNDSRIELIKLSRYLETNHIYSVFCTDPLLQWQIIYYSKEKINARYMPKTDRYPEYSIQVNADLRSKDRRTGVVGYYGQLTQNPDDNIQTFGRYYFVFPDPKYQDLIRIGYRF